MEHIPGDMVKYEAFEEHYRQVPAFKELNILLVPEEATRVAMLKAGEADLASVSLPFRGELEAAGVTTRPVLAPDRVAFLTYGAYDSRAKNMPVADIRVREALSLAINRKEISETLFQGLLEPPLPPARILPGYPDVDIDDMSFWEEKAAEYYRYDPIEAKRLLTEAGYPDGFDIKLFVYLTRVSEWTDLAVILQAYWAENLGVNAEIVYSDIAYLAPLMRGGPDGGPDEEILGHLMSVTTGTSASAADALTWFFYKPGWTHLTHGAAFTEQLDGLIGRAAYSEPTVEGRIDLVKEATLQVMDTHVYGVIGDKPGLVAFGPRVDADEMYFWPNIISVLFTLETAEHGK